MRLVITTMIAASLAGPALADMSASVDWGPTKKCFDSKSPPIKLSGVPAGTTRLDIRMTDLDAPNFHHGGGKVDYAGNAALAYGAFTYKGPCPPSRHKYKFTIKALDAKGKTLATANAAKSFP